MDKDRYELTKGEDRTRVSLLAHRLGDALTVFIYNENAHVGAVAVGEYHIESQRSSVSVITRPGHRDDIIAREAAKLISDAGKRPVCIVAGIHLDNITPGEITGIIESARAVVDEFIERGLARV